MTLDERALLEIPGPQELPVVGSALSLEPGTTLQSFITLDQQYSKLRDPPTPPFFFHGERLTLIRSRRPYLPTVPWKHHGQPHQHPGTVGRGVRREKVQEDRARQYQQAASGYARWAVHRTPRRARLGIAHRILMPVFGPIKIKEMFPEMKDIAQQLCLKWFVLWCAVLCRL